METAIEISRRLYGNAFAASAVVARADVFADALAGAPLAVAKNGPLLVTPSTHLDDRVATELGRVVRSGATVYVLGGTAAISSTVTDAIRRQGFTVVRLGGATRFSTATTIAESGLGSPATTFIATGQSFSDALVAGPPAASLAAAILLTDGTSMPSETKAYLDRRSGARYAIGATAVAADPSATAVGSSDPYETSRAVAQRWFPDARAAGLASGATFPDGLAGGVHAASVGGPLLLSAPESLSPPTATLLRSRAGQIERVNLYGGPAALAETVRTQVREALAPPPPPGQRATIDRPDAGGYMVHTVYAVPSDGQDRSFDTDGSIERSVQGFQTWLRQQTGGPALRMDTYQGALDIAFVRLPRTDADYKSSVQFVRDEVQKDIKQAGFTDPEKLYAVYYDGGSSWSCGGGAYPPELVGSVAAMYLKGTPPGASCADNTLGADPSNPGYFEYGMLHEIMHTLGLVAKCAPNQHRQGHVTGDPHDLMWAGDAPEFWSLPAVLDIGRDDYWQANIPGCPDLSRSAFLEPVPAGAEKPPGW